MYDFMQIDDDANELPANEGKASLLISSWETPSVCVCTCRIVRMICIPLCVRKHSLGVHAVCAVAQWVSDQSFRLSTVK